jgi:hypothetical protein
MKRCIYPSELVLLFSLLVTPLNSYAENTLEFEFDPYYSNAGYYISLTDKPIPEIQTGDEIAIYDRLISSALSKPRFLLIEASVNPLPLLGVFIKRNYPEKYDSAEIRGNINLVQALTEGFEEPYALSFFLGSIVQFAHTGETVKSKNKGYSGYLLSVGSRHIVNNTLIDDEWVELEWKIKGDQDFNNKTLSWSVRVGGKIHQNRDISDVIYFGLRRNHLDSTSDEVSWFDNSDVEYKIALNKEDYSLVEQSLFINKKWPAPFMNKSAFELGIGFILERNKYSGALQSQADDFRLIIRPSFAF